MLQLYCGEGRFLPREEKEKKKAKSPWSPLISPISKGKIES
jgi:hypothetical protein